MLGLFFQISCSESLQNTQNQSHYSSEEELSALKDAGYVNYRVSRYFANLAMNDFANENDWQNARVSDYSVIIYSAVDDTPRYYEFRVIKDGKEVGAVSCTAKEKEGSAGLSKYTDYKIVKDFGHLYSTISNNIRTTKLPSISLRSSKGLSEQDIQWHYRTVIGVKDATKTTIVTAFGKELFRYSKKTDKYYVMHDNGLDGNSRDVFYESSFKLYHFWSAHVEEK